MRSGSSGIYGWEGFATGDIANILSAVAIGRNPRRPRADGARHTRRPAGRLIMTGAARKPVVLSALVLPQMIQYPHRLPFGVCVQSIEHDRRARRHPHQIRCGLAKPLADTRRPFRKRGVEARAKGRNRSLRAPVKFMVQAGSKRGCSARGSRVACGRVACGLLAENRLVRESGLASIARHRYDRRRL